MGIEVTAKAEENSIRFSPFFFAASLATIADYIGIILDDMQGISADL